MPHLHRALWIGALTASTSASGLADVRIVSSSTVGGYPNIQAAVDASVDGDLIVVFDSHGSSVLIDDLSVAILAWPGQGVTSGPVRVQNLAPGKLVVLSGLEVPSPYPAPHPSVAGLHVELCAGSVRAQDCRFRGQATSDPTGTAGVRVVDCDDVVLSGCFATGGEGTYPGGWGGAGLDVLRARVAVHESELIGMFGNTGTGGFGRDGGPGALFRESEGYLSGTLARGGDGDDGEAPGVPGDGGHGLDVRDNSFIYAVGNVYVGGAGGQNCGLGCSDGQNGQTISVTGNGHYYEIGTQARALRIDPIGFDGGSVELAVEGQPGDEVSLHFSYAPEHAFVYGERGVRELGKPFAFAGPQADPFGSHATVPLLLDGADLGPIPASGVLQVEVELGSILQPSSVLLVQASARVGGERRLTNSRALFLPNCTDLDIDCQLGRVYVDADAAPGGDGTSWAMAYDRLEPALADPALSVWVAEGTYVPGPARSSSFELAREIRVYGGFAGNESSLDQRDPIAHPTILSGDRNGDDGPGFTNRGDNCFHVVRVTVSFDAPRLDGFHVRGGNATDAPSGTAYGGGIQVIESHDGLYPVAIANCEVYDNEAAEGAGVAMKWAYNSSITLSNCRLLGNRASVAGGGALFHYPDAARLVNTVLCGNQAGGRGAGVFSQQVQLLELVNCSLGFNGNGGSSPGAGAWVESPSTLDAAAVHNVILWKNANTLGSSESAQLHFAGALASEVRYSCIEGLASLSGPGNIGSNPRWSDAGGADGVHGTLDDDLSLIFASPCIDAGRNGYLPADELDLDLDGDLAEQVPVDLANAARRVDVPGTPDTGSGDAPLVDMGAYEKQP